MTEDGEIEMTDAEFETLMDLGHACAGAVGEFQNEGGSVDTGVGMGEFEAFVTVGDLEYKVTVRPYVRPSEVVEGEWLYSVNGGPPQADISNLKPGDRFEPVRNVHQ